MNRILLLESNSKVLEELVDAMDAFKAFFEVWTSDDHYEALDLLQSLEVDLLITGMDLTRPEELHALKHIRQQFPMLTIMCALESSAAKIATQLQALHIDTFLPKPLRCEILIPQIFKILKSGGYLWGIAISSFLQIAKMDEITCNLKVLSSGRTGRLHIENGHLIAAQTGNLRGEKAAFEILTWDSAALEVDYHELKTQREITSPLMNIMLESQRLKDEKNSLASEKRKYPRFACMIPVDYDVSDWSFHNFVRDLSLGGAYIITKDPVSIAESMMLTFTAPAIQKSCMIRGTVVRRDSYGIGINFDPLDPSQREVIESLLEQTLD